MKVLKQSDVNDLIQLHQAGQFHLAEIKAKKLLNDFPQELMLHNVKAYRKKHKKSLRKLPIAIARL